MKITAAQLHKNLHSNSLPPVIWVSGDEPLLVLEACDAIRNAASKQGITERNVIEVDARFDGSDLIAANQSMSLFGERECIELRLQAKFNDKGRKALLEYVQTANPDNLLLIVSERIEGSQSKAKWFNQVVDAGWWLPLWPIEHHQLPGWITQRIQQAGLSAEPDAVALLAERIDGNLLAAKQEIEKLALLAEDGRISTDLILSSVADSSRYTVFDLSSAFLTGDLARTLRIMHGLASEGVEPPIVLWLITRELRLLIELAEAQAQGQSINGVFKRLRIFDKRQNDYQLAMQRASVVHYQRCLVSCSRIDAMIKGQVKGDPWTLISEMLVAITAPGLPAYQLQ
ncbi:DNA polymerase III subunit delta [Reinekea sp. G2M2-21]|uniref:DNA polymerase III subunit delta n=1 Tax=Reinekea sp. G2M2-21 TaxID=2788942 RepID=UPI0018A8E325|nr:DNA polymerase III subunit delta [Reinekea sp. G2M2-21]